MRIGKLAFLISTIFLFCVYAYGQTETPTPASAEANAKAKETAEKVVEMIDQAARDGAGLRLPLNRAIVFTLAGDLLWNFDEKRAREMFRSVTGELITYNQETEKERSDNARNNFGFVDMSDPRAELLPVIATHDAQMALEMLYATRPARLAEAIAKDARPAATTAGAGGGPGGRGGNRNQDTVAVGPELALEQRLTLLAAREDPDKLIKLINDSLSKGVTNTVLQPLQALYKKDSKKADELASKVVSALTSAEWSTSPQNFRTALNFIQVGNAQNTTAKPGEKQFRFSDAQDKDLAVKIASYLSQPTPSNQTINMINQALPVIQQYAPEKVVQLKQVQASSSANGNGRAQQRQALFSPNSTPEDILAQIPKMTTDQEKNMAYSAAAGKISQITDDDRAKKLLDQIGDEKTRTAATDQYNAAKIARSAAGGNLEDARKLVSKMSAGRSQIQAIVSLATAFFRKGTPKEIEAAQSLMKDARGMVNPFPDDEDELADLMEVVKGYAIVEPETAFRLVEPITDQFNEVVNASAVLSKYNRRNTSFKKGELVMRPSGSGGGNRGGGPGGFGGPGGGGPGGPGGDVLFYRYISQMQLLGKADLDQMGRLADRFSRADARTIVKLFVVQGFLAEDKKPADKPAAPTAGANPVTPDN